MKKLTPLDILFLALENTKAPMHAGILQVFDIPSNDPGYAEKVYQAFLKSKPAAPWNSYPDMTSMGGPCWREAEDFDSHYHVRRIALPRPGSEEELMTLVSHLYPGLLDRRLPLWECNIIEGLQGNRFAIFIKGHHAYADGISGARAIFDTMNNRPKASAITPIWTWQRSGKKAGTKVRPTAVEKLEKSLSSAMKRTTSLSEVTRELASIGGQVLGVLPRSIRSPFNAEKNSLYHSFHSGARNFAHGSIPLKTVKDVAKKYDATVNDVVMTICDHAMVQYLSEKGETPQQALTGMMAVSTRAKGDQNTSNAAAMALTGLGEPKADVVSRLQQVNQNTGEAKIALSEKTAEGLVYSSLILTFASQLPLKIPRLNEVVSPTSNLFVSNIPGMGDETKYLGSARMSGVYTAPIVQEGVPVNITLGSYNKNLCLGFGASSEVMPDVANYSSLCFQAFDELVEKTLGKSKSRITRKKAGTAAAKKVRAAQASRRKASKV